MSFVAEKEYDYLGTHKGAEDHDRDLVHELDKRLNAIWRYDQYLQNADGKKAIQELWANLRRQEEENVKKIKNLIRDEITKGCF